MRVRPLFAILIRRHRYLAWQAIHSPDQVPTSYEEQFLTTIPDTEDGVGQHRRTVAGMIAAMDQGMGNVSDALVQSGLKPNTVLIFTTGGLLPELANSTAVISYAAPHHMLQITGGQLKASTQTWRPTGHYVA